MPCLVVPILVVRAEVLLFPHLHAAGCTLVEDDVPDVDWEPDGRIALGQAHTVHVEYRSRFEMREKGVVLSELIRTAIDERYEHAFSSRGPRDVPAIRKRPSGHRVSRVPRSRT